MKLLGLIIFIILSPLWAAGFLIGILADMFCSAFVIGTGFISSCFRGKS